MRASSSSTTIAQRQRPLSRVNAPSCRHDRRFYDKNIITNARPCTRQHVDLPQLRDVLLGFVSLRGHFESSIGFQKPYFKEVRFTGSQPIGSRLRGTACQPFLHWPRPMRAENRRRICPHKAISTCSTYRPMTFIDFQPPACIIGSSPTPSAMRSCAAPTRIEWPERP